MAGMVLVWFYHLFLSQPLNGCKVWSTQFYHIFNHLFMQRLVGILTLITLTTVVYSQLQQVVSVFRHGARYHLSSIYDGNTTRPLWGQLTGVGMKQHQTLGKFIRQDYIDKIKFLSPSYLDGEIQVYSNDCNRTYQSVVSQLYGLYPLGQGQKLGTADPSFHLPPYSNTTDSPQKVFAMPQGYRQQEIIIDRQMLLHECPNKEKQYQKNINLQLEIYQQMNLTYYPFFKRMAQAFQMPLEQFNLEFSSSLYSALTVDRYLGRPLPTDRLSEDDYQNLKHIHNWISFFKINFNFSRALNTGKITKLLADFDDRIQHPDRIPKWSFLSTHDTDCTALMNSLNISSSQCIEDLYRKGSTSALNCFPSTQYAMSLIFQLHTDDRGNSYYVKVRYNGGYIYLCEKRSVTCDYKEWRSRVENILINVDMVCKGPTDKI